jgi:maltooligosyltrehalose trehalohydrolase
MQSEEALPLIVDAAVERRYPIGAEVSAGGVHVRVWAPNCKKVEVIIDGDDRALALSREENGYWSALVPDTASGTRYSFRLDDSERLYPDPASRFQPEGPHGPSQVVDPLQYRWHDAEWRGCPLKGQIIYEMHVGTFTPEGTWRAAAEQLAELADAGITTIEMMPVAEFPGRFGWGYDGVDLFAASHLYGTPDDLRYFVDRAHQAGLAVILDVVYNHFGPDGNYLKCFTPDYFTDKYKNEWGEAINFDGPNSGPVREFFTTNAAYWIDEFHFDGLRLDATQQIFDDSPTHILAEITRAVRQASDGRATIVIAENEPQETRLVRSFDSGGYGMDALWNDDFHHSAIVALTGHREAYYTDYLGAPQEFISAAKYGYLYQGQWYGWQKQHRGTAAFDVPPQAFVNYLENHDQVANSARGERLHQLTSRGRHRAMTALLLLLPGTPMLFQGQEFSASAPFLYFADHKPGLAQAVSKGRKEFLTQFRSLATDEMQKALTDPEAESTFECCKLDLGERERNRAAYDLHRDLLRLRRDDPVFSAQRQRGLDGAVLSHEAFVLRFFGENGDDRLMVVNLGRDLHLVSAPEPLLSRPAGKPWSVIWSSEDPKYGGIGTPLVDTDDESWRIPGEAAVVLAPTEIK